MPPHSAFLYSVPTQQYGKEIYPCKLADDEFTNKVAQKLGFALFVLNDLYKLTEFSVTEERLKNEFLFFISKMEDDGYPLYDFTHYPEEQEQEE